MMIKVFDRDHNGTIDFREYATLHKVDYDHKQLIVFQFLLQMEYAFVSADRDRSGYLDIQEIRGAFVGAGFQLSVETITDVCKVQSDMNSFD